MTSVRNSFFRGLGLYIREVGFAFIHAQHICHDTFRIAKPFRNITNISLKRPAIDHSVWIAPNAIVTGSVRIYDYTSIWYGAVIKGDRHNVELHSSVVLGDKSVIQTVDKIDTDFPAAVLVGRNTLIGENCTLTSCRIGDNVHIHDNCVIGEGSVIEEKAIIAKGSVVLPGSYVKKQEYWEGNPAIFVRNTTSDELEETAELIYQKYHERLMHEEIVPTLGHERFID